MYNVSTSSDLQIPVNSNVISILVFDVISLQFPLFKSSKIISTKDIMLPSPLPALFLLRPIMVRAEPRREKIAPGLSPYIGRIKEMRGTGLNLTG